MIYCDCVIYTPQRSAGRTNNGQESGNLSLILSQLQDTTRAVHTTPLSLCSHLSKGNATLSYTVPSGEDTGTKKWQAFRAWKFQVRWYCLLKLIMAFYCVIRGRQRQPTKGTSTKTHGCQRNWFAKSVSCTKMETTKFEQDLSLTSPQTQSTLPSIPRPPNPSAQVD